LSIRWFIFLLLCCGTAHAEKSKGQSVGDQSSKQGDTVWLEEKISPTTRWLDNLVKPLTVWLEQQIHQPEPELNSQTNSAQSAEEVNSALEQTQVNGSDNAIDPVSEAASITVEQAARIAQQHIAGEVLYIKLMPMVKQYRVKLISTLGEIHILYISAASGDIVLPNKKASAEQNPKADIEGRGQP